MKKFMMALVASVFFLCSCSMLNKEPEKNGTISIDFGGGTRSVLSMNPHNITNLVVSIDGPVEDSKEGKWGSHIEFENVPVGEYTVSVVPYIGDVAGKKVSVTVEVSANETAVADLTLAVEKILKTKFVMFNFDYNNGNPYKVYDSVKDVPSDLRITEGTADFKGVSYMPEGTSYAEDKNGDIYYISGDALRCKGKSEAEFNINMLDFIGTVKLYYDAVTDVLYLFQYFNTTGDLFKVNIEEHKFDKVSTLLIGQISSDLLSGYKGFCVEGDKFFLYGKESNEFKLFYGKINSESINTISEMKVAEIFNDEFSDAMITDMTIIEKGKILMLLSQNLPSFMSNQITIDNYTGYGTIYSRGAIAELSYDNNGFIKNKIGGWFDDSKKRTLTQNGEKPMAYSNRETLRNVDLYGPSKAERKNYFCGPKRIVCVRPKEVYIVDEGVNVRLADWTRRHDGCQDIIYPGVPNGVYQPDSVGRSGNVFRVSRIVKVNLGNFAMNVEKEAVVPLFKISATETGGQARYSSSFNSNDFIFSSISVSGSSDNLGYVECPTTGYLGIHPFMEEE